MTLAKHSDLPDPMAPPQVPDLPEETLARARAWSRVWRDNAYLRRNIHRLQRKLNLGVEPQPFRTVPRYAKLAYRPIVLGLAPTIYARSHIAWDDPNGDQLAGRFGMHGFMQLMANFKLRNLYSHPVQDLPLEYQGTARKAEALAKLVESGVFKGRVVIVAGNEMRQIAGLTCDRDYIGPVKGALGGSSLLISMVEPKKSRKWSTAEGRREGLWIAVLALLAARLPAADSVADAMQFGLGQETPESWRSLGGGDREGFNDLMARQPGEVWHVLCRLGLAAPVDLAQGLWFEIGPDRLEACFTGGRASIVYDPAGRVSGAEYVHGTLTDNEGKIVFESRSRKPHLVRQACIDAVIRRGWEYPFMALDRRLSDLHGASMGTPR